MALSDKQKRYLDLIAAGMPQGQSAQKAGYSNQAGAIACTRGEEARRYVQEAIQRRITNDLLPLAVGTLTRVMTDPKAPAGAAVQAAKIVLDRALPEDKQGLDKPISDMSADELGRMRDVLAGQLMRLNHECSDRAKPILDMADFT